MLVRRLPTIALLAGLPILLANCSSDREFGGSAGAPSSSAGSGSSGSPATAGAPAVAGAAPAAGAPSVAGGGSSSVGGGGSASVAGGGSGGTATGGTGGGSAGGSTAGAAGKAGGGTGGGSTTGFSLTSPDYKDGEAIPVDATCAVTPSSTKPLMPALAWTGVPAGTMSFAITFIDTTRFAVAATKSQGEHYAMYNVPKDVTSIAKGLPSGSPPMGIANMVGAVQKGALAAAYLGPCPNNTGTMSDDYDFTIYALSQATLPGVTASSSVDQILTALTAANPLGKAVLKGTSNAKGTLR